MARKTNPELFTPEGVNRTQDQLQRLIGLICLVFNITQDKYIQKHSSWALRSKMDVVSATSSRNNTRKTITGDKLTWHMVKIFIVNILKFDILNMSITIRDTATDETRTISSTDRIGEDGKLIGHEDYPTQDNIHRALNIALQYQASDQTEDGKNWIINEMIKELAPDTYDQLIKKKSDWPVGIKPYY